MSSSLQTLVLALATLAVGGVEGFKYQKRANPVDTSNIQGGQNVLIANAQQTQFYTQMQFGSGHIALAIYGLLSTTRGDIILPGVYSQNATGFVSQGKTFAEGPIYSGPVSAAGWTVPDQDIIYYENSNIALPIQEDGVRAYAGFGIWPNASTIYQAIGDWSADSFVARVLAEPSAQPYWTLLINPLEDDKGTDSAFGGLITVGEIVNVTQIFNVTEEQLKESNFPDLGLVTNYPALNNTGSYNDVLYYIVIDAIKWGSVSATLTSTVSGTPSGKISAYLDSTYAWNVVPYSVTEQLYKNLPSATYKNDTRLWYFTCTELTVNITIAGWDYPLSPLTVVERVDELNCVGTFQANAPNAGGDVVLGVPFLKNVYALFGYQSRSSAQVNNPYVQLMPITNIVDAHNDWVTWYNKWSGSSSSSSKPSSTPPHSSPSPSSYYPTPSSPPVAAGYPASSSSSSSSSPSPSSSPSSAPNPQSTGGTNSISGAVQDNNDEVKSDSTEHYLPAIIVGSIVGGLALIGGLIFAVTRLRHGRDGKGAYRGLGKPEGGAGPVKVALYDDEAASGRYGDGGQGQYTDPYKG